MKKTAWKILLLLTLLFMLPQCSTVKTKRSVPQKASVDESKLYQRGLKLFKANKNSEAAETFDLFLNKYPVSEYSDQAHLMAGDLAFIKGDLKKAAAHYQEIYENTQSVEFEKTSRSKASQIYFKSGNASFAEKIVEDGIKNSADSETRAFYLKLKYEFIKDSPRTLDTLLVASQLSSTLPDGPDKVSFRYAAQNITENQLNFEQLSVVASSNDYGIFRGVASLRLGLLSLEKGELSQARSFLEQTMRYSPDTEVSERARELILQLDSRSEVDPLVIGAVLPLTGKYSKLGLKTLRGLQLGLGIFGKKRTDIKLAVLDSEGNPSLAQRAVERLVLEDHAMAIVGGLLGKEAEALAAKSKEFGVPCITLTQKSGITQIGENVFRNSTTSEMQVRHLVDHAMRVKKLKRFAIFYPNDPYGVEYANLFWDEVLVRGGTIEAAQAYDPKEKDFRSVVQRLVGTYYLDDRSIEYKMRFKEWEKQNPSRTGRKKIPTDLLPPVVNFEAIFIPDGIRAIGQIAPMLSYNDVENLTLLGTNLWNAPDLVNRVGKTSLEPLFVDSLNGEGLSSFGVFQKTFSEVFGESPDVFETQAFDTGILIRIVMDSRPSSRPAFQQSLANAGIFNGALGPMSMLTTREVLRPLVSFSIKDGRIVQEGDL